MSQKSDGNTPALVTRARKQSREALGAIFLRRQAIVCTLAVLAAAGLLFLLVQLIPRTAKPISYRAGELEIKSFTQVVGYRKVLATTEFLSGLGQTQAGSYTYQAGRHPDKDVEEYRTLLQKEYQAVVTQEAQQGDQAGSLTLTVPTEQPDKLVELAITYDAEKCLVAIAEKLQLPAKPEKVEAKITPERARELLLTLTKQETGFKSDISVYTSKLEEATAQVDGWDYYVFTVLADYSATRIEYRGTFYISCQDGVILSYDKETGATSRVRAAQPE